MSRLYAYHTSATIFSRAVTTHDVQYACRNSAPGSKLRQLYIALVATNFANSDRIPGAVDEWDKLLLEHADMRLLVLQSFRMDAIDRAFVKSEEHYLEASDALKLCCL